MKESLVLQMLTDIETEFVSIKKKESGFICYTVTNDRKGVLFEITVNIQNMITVKQLIKTIKDGNVEVIMLTII